MLPCNIDVTAVFLTSSKACQVADVTYGERDHIVGLLLTTIALAEPLIT